MYMNMFTCMPRKTAELTVMYEYKYIHKYNMHLPQHRDDVHTKAGADKLTNARALHDGRRELVLANRLPHFFAGVAEEVRHDGNGLKGKKGERAL
jgi:hypothetical protein